MAPDAFDEDDDARAALDEEEAASTPASVWLEESSRARAWANLLSPGLPRHRDALGDGLAPRPEVRARLRAHVSSLGPPHTLVLTGPEGSGKTTELAVLADWLRREEREDPRVDDRFDEAGYITLPPCLWGTADEGLAPPTWLPPNTPMLSIKKNRNTHAGHFGEMASWQMRGVNIPA